MYGNVPFFSFLFSATRYKQYYYTVYSLISALLNAELFQSPSVLLKKFTDAFPASSFHYLPHKNIKRLHPNPDALAKKSGGEVRKRHSQIADTSLARMHIFRENNTLILSYALLEEWCGGICFRFSLVVCHQEK